MKIMLPLLLLLLSGCATLPSQQQLIGLSREEILQCMRQAVNREALAYQEVLSYSGSAADPMGPLKKLAGLEPKQRSCQVKFVLENGKVTSVRYQAPDGSDIKDDSMCSFMVENCFK